MHTTRSHSQVLVIGSGIAGATCALTLADAGFEVTLVSSGKGLDSGNTVLAQGGIVYQGGNNDARALEKDILTAGWNHNYRRAVRHLCRRGPDTVREVLVERLQVPFARAGECEWDLTREGGHSRQRVMHCADFTGRAIMEALGAAVKAAPNIRMRPNRTAVDLITSQHHTTRLEYRYQRVNRCCGAYVLNENAGNVETMLADYTVLATGGLGQIYLHTTNTPSCIGSGLTMAYRAGVRVMNCEYVQFHPTALYHKARRRFLITEALRGEGARLVNAEGEQFMGRYDDRRDLAPRDIVSRAIVNELLRTGDDNVYLDAANFVPHDLKTRFPTVYEMCASMGIDIAAEPIPVVPAAHYFCGGVLTDTAGRTDLDGLFAVGETACTGVHGANRLASTSLLEGLVWGKGAGEAIAANLKSKKRLAKLLAESIPEWQSPGENRNEDPALIAQDWATIRSTMWNYAGIIRTGQRLHRAFEDLRSLYKKLHDFYKTTPLSKSLVDLFHGSHAAYIVTTAAMRNKKSIGCHFRDDG